MPADADYEEVAWTPIRRATARRMADSARDTAPVTLHGRAGAGAALERVRSLREQGIAATFTHAVLWATAAALRDHPALNAVWDDGRLLRARRIDIALAVEVDEGLVAPVIGDAGSLGLGELVAAARAAVERARAGAFTPGDAAGGTFTVSNLGKFGVEWFTPIVNPPQVGVLGVGAVLDDACRLSLTFDHRAVDGAAAARFLADLAAALARIAETDTAEGGVSRR